MIRKLSMGDQVGIEEPPRYFVEFTLDEKEPRKWIHRGVWHSREEPCFAFKSGQQFQYGYCAYPWKGSGGKKVAYIRVTESLWPGNQPDRNDAQIYNQAQMRYLSRKVYKL